jgi:hypothetical protein
MSIRMELQPISAAQYEKLAKGELSPEEWDRDAAENLDKAWEVLYYLLADGHEDNPPLVTKAITGDLLVASMDLPYAPPFGEVLMTLRLPDGSQEEESAPGLAALSPDLVREIASELAAITEGEVARRATYVQIPGLNGGLIHADNVRGYVRAMEGLKETYADCAAGGSAMAMWLE